MKHIKRKLMLIILSIITIINLNYADEIIIKQGNTTTIKTVKDEQIFGATPTYEEIDLSENVIDPPEHIHRYVTAYDSNKDGYHYQKCSICGIINEATKVKHSFIEHWNGTMGDNGYNPNSSIYGDETHAAGSTHMNGYRCVWLTSGTMNCSCGYSFGIPKYNQEYNTNHIIDVNNTSGKNGSISWYNGVGYHGNYCLKCNWGDAQTETCKDINGNIVNCLHPGTCAICGEVYTSNSHRLDSKSISKFDGSNGDVTEVCPICHKNKLTIKNFKMSYNPSTKYLEQECDLVSYITGIEPNTFSINNDYIAYTNPNYTITKTGSNTYHLKFTGTISNITIKYMQNMYIRIAYEKTTNKATQLMCSINLINPPVKSDFEAPKVKNEDITISDIQKKTDATGKEWIILQTFNVKGTENYSELVNLKIDVESNGTKKRYYDGNLQVNASTKEFSQNITPAIEVTSGNIIFTFTDQSNNTTTITKTLPPSDNFAPEFKNSDDYTNPWTKEKVITLNAEDNGSGNVLLTLNNKNNFSIGSKSNNSYTKTYKIVGDVYSEINPIAYAQDDLLNMSYQTIKVNRIDNTNPTIENVEQVKNGYGSSIITIKGNDKHASKGTGSGIVNYAVVKKGVIPSDSDFSIIPQQTGDLFTAEKDLQFFGDYDIYAKDKVGNISNVYQTNVNVDIKYNIVCEYKCNNETKTYTINDVVISEKKDLPKVKALPIETKIYGWFYNDIQISNSLDLDKYITENNETISIKLKTDNENANIYLDNGNLEFTYNIICEYFSDNGLTSKRVKNVKIGTISEFPKIKVLPTSAKVYGWFYNDIQVSNSLDLDKYIKTNNEIITIRYKVEDGARCYGDDVLTYNIKYLYNKLKEILALKK